MEVFKIQNFEREYPEDRFPNVRQLTLEESNRFEVNIRITLVPGWKIANENLLEIFHNNAMWFDNISAEDIDFNFLGVLRKYKISSESVIYITWGSFDNIDEISLEDFSNYFDDIWYPVIDDIGIFDKSLSWIILIAHYGRVGVVRI